MVQATRSPVYRVRWWQNENLRKVASQEEYLSGEFTSSPAGLSYGRIPDTSLPEWGTRAVAKITQLAALQDGFCSDGIRPDGLAVQKARQILSILFRENTKPRRIAPIADGGIVFIFQAELKTAHIVVNNGGDAYMLRRASAEAELETTGSSEPKAIVAELIEFIS